MSKSNLSAKELKAQQQQLRDERNSYLGEISKIIEDYNWTLQVLDIKFGTLGRTGGEKKSAANSIQDKLYPVLKRGIQRKAYQDILELLKPNLPDCECPEFEEFFPDSES